MLPHCTREHTIEQRGKPLYVVMLRDPWRRFVSEWKSWGGYRFNTLDWSAVALPDESTTFPFFNHSRVVFHHSVARPKGERATLAEMVGLPAEFLCHNRYTKMLGGERADFNFNFSSKISMGSRWIGGMGEAEAAVASSYPGTLKRYHDRALQNLQRAPNVLPLLQERFGESLCILEVILGDLQNFHWEEKNHSHGALLGAYIAPASIVDANSATSNTKSRSSSPEVEPHIYNQWVAKNTDDLLLYNHTLKIFNVQLKSALRYLDAQLKEGLVTLQRIQEHQPHCITLQDWKATQIDH